MISTVRAGAWLPRLEAEHDNLGALGWAGDQPDGETEIRLVGALGRFWLLRGYIGEGREWVERALARPDFGDAPLSVRALLCRAGGMLERRAIGGDQLFESRVSCSTRQRTIQPGR
ncbi:MAG: hypothetical protein M9890_13235 [Thermomicrobiales bacterium]|nr:hypothetical protein [Thermomicrobiales bacterium]